MSLLQKSRYSGGITNAVTELNCVFYTYRVKLVYLADKFLKGMELQEIKVVSMTRLDDLQKATEDKEYYEQLIKEYNII